MGAQKAAVVCGMQGFGGSVKEAKEDAQRRLSAVMQGPWPVTVLEHQGLLAFVSRQPGQGENQWGFIVRPAGGAQGQHFIDANYLAEEDAVAAACYSLAQQAGTYQGLPSQLSQPRRRELDAWYRWQAAYASAIKDGAGDADARASADTAVQQPTAGWARLHEALSERGMRETVRPFALSSFGAISRVVVDEACDGWVAHNAVALAEVALPNHGMPDLDAAQSLLGRFGPTTRRNTGGNVRVVAGFIESYGRRVLFMAGDFVAAFDAPEGDLDAAIEAAAANPELSQALILIE